MVSIDTEHLERPELGPRVKEPGCSDIFWFSPWLASTIILESRWT